MVRVYSLCFFFQAEDGIRDDLVTGVQTCALPISDMLIVLNQSFISGSSPSQTYIRSGAFIILSRKLCARPEKYCCMPFASLMANLPVTNRPKLVIRC